MPRAAALLVCLVLACDPDPNGNVPSGDAELAVSDQALSLTSVVVIERVAVPVDAWVQVRQGTCAAPAGGGDGRLLVEAGTHDDVEVELEVLLARPASGETPFRFCVSLVDDVATPGTFTSEDQPLEDASGPIQAELDGAVGPDTPDVRMTFGAIGTTDYELRAVAPARFAIAVPVVEPVLTLTGGLRYAFHFPSTHPMAFVGTPTDETSEDVLISSSGGGAWDTDDSIARAASSGVLAFTASSALLAAMAGDYDDLAYVCEAHPSAMRGDVTVP